MYTANNTAASKVYFETFNDTSCDYEVGKTYIYKHTPDGSGLKLEFLGVRKNRKDESLGHINAEIGDAITDPWVLVFKWLEGDNAPASQGRKGSIIAIGRKAAKKHISCE